MLLWTRLLALSLQSGFGTSCLTDPRGASVRGAFLGGIAAINGSLGPGITDDDDDEELVFLSTA